MSRTAQKVLVTGAEGLIGSTLCRILSESDTEFTAIYHTPPAHEPQFQFRVLDLVDAELLNLDRDINTVFHCAARIPGNGFDDQDCVANNTRIDRNLARFVREQKLRIVFASTTSVYGSFNGLVTEDTPVRPQNAYAEAKLESEQLFRAASETSYVLRINAPYGPGQRHATVLKTFIERALRNEDLFYHGTGSRSQDFVDSRDVAYAFMKCLDRGARAGTYSIASGYSIDMKSLGKLVVTLIPNSRSKVLPSGMTDPQEGRRAEFSISKAANMLNWQPQISLKQGIVDWIAANRE